MGPLRHGTTVAIVGGGPGGVSCGITLKRLSRQLGRAINVILYEGKTFEGKVRYNQCAGVVSPPIRHILRDGLEIPFPDHLVQRVITGYVLHSDTDRVTLDGDGEPSHAVRRVTFDAYLLDQAKRAGVEIIQARVTDIEIHPNRAMVYSDMDNTRADVVVGAFGLDDGTCKLFERATPYRQPGFISSIVTNLHPEQAFIDRFGHHIHAFLPSFRDIEFGAVTPKMNHFTINIAGAAVTATWMDRFLAHPPVTQILPPGFDIEKAGLDYFKGRFPSSPAHHLYGDRYVTVGDAAGLLRPFKGKGVNAACLAGMRAAETIMKIGISRRAFRAYYEACREVTEDLPYGRALRWLTIHTSRYRLLDPVLELASKDERLRMALFNCVSAHKPFKQIFQETVDLELISKLTMTLGSSFLRLNGAARKLGGKGDKEQG